MMKIIGLPIRAIHPCSPVRLRPSLLRIRLTYRLSPFLPANFPPQQKPAPKSLFLPAVRHSTTDISNELECVRYLSDPLLPKPAMGYFLFASIADPHRSCQCRIL